MIKNRNWNIWKKIDLLRLARGRGIITMKHYCVLENNAPKQANIACDTWGHSFALSITCLCVIPCEVEPWNYSDVIYRRARCGQRGSLHNKSNVSGKERYEETIISIWKKPFDDGLLQLVPTWNLSASYRIGRRVQQLCLATTCFV